MRSIFDEVCFGWKHMDGSFEPLAMPTEWRYDARGSQILESRIQHGHFQVPEWKDNAHYPSQEEKRETFLNAHPQYRNSI